MAAEAPKIVGLSLAVAAVVALGLVGLPKLLGAAGGVEVELITLLKQAEASGLELPVLSGTLKGKKISFQRITVTVEPSAQRAVVLATLDFTGSVGATEVSSLGVERIPFVFDGHEWKPESTLAPRLVGVVNALEKRRRTLQSGDGAALRALLGVDGGVPEAEAERWVAMIERSLTIDAWFIRLEREEVDVSEQYRFKAIGGDRPFRQDGPRKLKLAPGARGEFFFPTGLM